MRDEDIGRGFTGDSEMGRDEKVLHFHGPLSENFAHSRVP